MFGIGKKFREVFERTIKSAVTREIQQERRQAFGMR